MIGLGVFVAIGMLGHYIDRHPDKFAGPSTQPTIQPDPSPRDPTTVAMDAFKIKRLSFIKGGTVAIGNFTFENVGDRDVKDIRLRCDHSNESGTIIDSSSPIIYEVFKAHSVRTIRNLNVGFTHSRLVQSGCRITSLTVIEPGAAPFAQNR